MYLGNFIKNVSRKYYKINFSGLAFNSKKVKKNNIFFAFKGNKLDGNRYISEAIERGAKIIVSDENLEINKKNIIFIKHKKPRKILAEISFKLLTKKPENLVAVTGTNGKSSVSDFYYQILNLNNKRSASIGTVGIQFDNKNKTIGNTTLDPITLMETINHLSKKKIKNIVLEASSHGLKQNRLDGLIFDIGIFTNLSHDHLDYHKNFKDYLNSKLYLFKFLIKNKGIVITDSTIPQYKFLKKIADKKKLKLLTIYSKNSDLELISHKYENEQQILKVKIKNKKQIIDFKLNLIGKIQIKNVLMAMMAASRCGINLTSASKFMSRIKPTEGRLENIGKLKNNSKVILDYAHTPDALKTVLKNIKEQFPLAKIRLLFGCGGDRDKTKRSKMGLIASKFADVIYLTDDNPRGEDPKKIRNEIKKGIKGKNIIEISDRKFAINNCINDLCTGEVAIIAGKGHEKTQEYKRKKYYFSDRKEILNSLKVKNKKLFSDQRLNIIQEKTKLIPQNLKLNKISINSKDLKKNDIFFAIKGRKKDGSKFLNEARKKKSSLLITHKLNKNISLSKQIKVKNTLKFLTDCARKYRNNIDTRIIGITGSCGKTTLKKLLGQSLSKIAKTYFSPKSFNNKFGVPLSMLNLKQNRKFGVFEVGMDKKGEIDFLSKILKPNLGIITNISYAHSKNFKNINGIAEAKSEIINNIASKGSIILNKDDQFYKFLSAKAVKKKLKIFSFSLKDKNSYSSIRKIIKISNKFKIEFSIGSKKFFYYSNSNSKNHLHNLLAALTAISLFFDLRSIPKNIFLDFKCPEGRGDYSKLKFRNKIINFIDESYNSNPLSLETALTNFGNIKLKNNFKHILLGDMLELGKDSINHHISVAKIINKLDIDKVHIYGKDIKKTYRDLKRSKKGLVMNNLSKINELIKISLNNNDYLMIKGSNSTGLFKQSQLLKQNRLNAL
tara:strand:- start:3460 stop:6315 length:2856 start_codon:yes stop_codon:yes gene_type:complete